MVIIDDSSYMGVCNDWYGMLGQTHVQADMNCSPGIDPMGAKSVGVDAALRLLISLEICI